MSTSRDVRHYVEAALDAYAGDYDVLGIVDELRDSEHWPVPDRPVGVLDDMPGFWQIVERHDISGGGDAA